MNEKMSESEEDELAALRKEREARLGLSGRTLVCEGMLHYIVSSYLLGSAVLS